MMEINSIIDCLHFDNSRAEYKRLIQWKHHDFNLLYGLFDFYLNYFSWNSIWNKKIMDKFPKKVYDDRIVSWMNCRISVAIVSHSNFLFINMPFYSFNLTFILPTILVSVVSCRRFIQNMQLRFLKIIN